MRTIPIGWTTSSLDALASDVSYGYTAKSNSASGDARMLRITDIQDGRVLWEQVPFCQISEEGLARYSLQDDDLVFARTGATVGKSYLIRDVPKNSVFASYLIRVRLHQVGMSRYLAHYFGSYQYWNQITEFSAGIGQPNVNGSKLKCLRVPLAPEKEQQRIADKLDIVLASVNLVDYRLARAASLIKRFKQAVIAAATSGQLTIEWREAHTLTNWIPRTLDSLCLFIGDGPFGSNLKSDDYTESGARVVRLENIGHLFFNDSKQTFIALPKYESLRKHTLEPGDLLFSSFVDEEVRVCEFPDSIVEPTINKADCFCLRVDASQINRHYLAYRLACRNTYESLKALVHGATRPRINLRQLRSFEVLVPSVEEQTEIVRRVEVLFAYADRLEARLHAAQTATERLTPALLAKAFRGELVSQDTNDEPASELLRRFQAVAVPVTAKRAERRGL